MSKGPTARQLEILRFIATHATERGFSPTIREIGDKFEIGTLRGVTVHLDALERKGLLLRTNLARTMSVTKVGKQALGLAADPAERLRILETAVARYLCLKRQYDVYRGMPGGLSLRGMLEEHVYQAQEALFCLLPEDGE
jgi:SOS-response transcriptional repressor LexA